MERPATKYVAGLLHYGRMIFMMVNKIRTLLETSLETLSTETNPFIVEVPNEGDKGDYSTNVAMVNASKTGIGTRDLAQKITECLLENKPKWIEKIEVAGAGFINFYLSRDFISKKTKDALDDKYGKNNEHNGEKILIEYTDPNPFKEFHIGHLMSNAVGESISRLLEFSGAEVKRACYQGDIGLHVAKAIWAMTNSQELTGGSAIGDFGKAYALGSKAYENNETAKKEIIELNKKIYNHTDQNINQIYENGLKTSKAYFEYMFERLGTKFDYYFFESETGPIGVDIIQKNKGVFESSDGAVVYKGEKVGLHTRVFISSEGLPTYEAKELGLFKEKLNRWNPDSLVVITGNEIKDYFKVVLSVAGEIAELKDISQKTKHISHGMLRLPSGKMSSRTGDVITAEALLNEVSEKLKDKIDDTGLLDAVSVGAVKYSMLKQEAGKDIIFDFEKSLSFVGDSGPYLQYTYARCLSLLKKGEEEDIQVGGPLSRVPLDSGGDDSLGTLKLERVLLHFPEVVEKAVQNYAPHHIANYLHVLASTFNTFYGRSQIVEKDNPESGYKLLVTNAVAKTLEKGLYLLGMQAPDKM